MANRSGEWNGVTLAGGRYLITARLGVGGMGAVYRAVDRNLDADVVIKVPHQVMLDDPDFAGRFTREIRSLVKLSHPRIVKVTDVGEWDGSPFAVMQFLSGGSLEDRQQFGSDGRSVPCDPREVPKWLIGIAQALDYVHTQGYIHRDVKPGNILFDAQGHSFLSDFGVAKVLSESSDTQSARSMTGAGKVLGTPEYMAPELIMGEKVDGRVDQYALAITVYELLCGRRPFEGEGDVKTRVLVLHTTTPPPALLEWQPTLSDRLSEAVLKGLAKDSNARYPTCTALAAAVVAAVKELPARAPDQVVRIQCPSCGKSVGLPQADFLRIQQAGGRRVPCPNCQQTITIGGNVAGQRTGTMVVPSTTGSGAIAAPQPAAQRSGTMIVPGTGGSGAVAAPQPAPQRSGTMIVPGTGGSGAVTAPQPAAQRSGTMIVPGPGAPAPAAPAAASRQGTMIVTTPNDATPGSPPGGHRSGTMIVDNAGQPGTPAGRGGTMIVSTPQPEGGYSLVEEDNPAPLIAVSVAPPVQPPQLSAVVSANAKSSSMPFLWIGLGVGGSVLAMVIIAVLALRPAAEPKPAGTTTAEPPNPQVVDASATGKAVEDGFKKILQPPASKTQAPGSAEGFPAAPPAKVAQQPTSSAPAPFQFAAANVPAPASATTPGKATYLPPGAAPPRFGGFPAPPSSPVKPVPDPAETVPKNENADTPTKDDEPPGEQWSPQIASRKPLRAKETLDKIMTSGARFQNQVVIPEGMYCLEERAQRLPNGHLQLGVSQSRIELARNGSPNVRTLKAIDIEIEPKLVDVLQQASRTQPDNLRINPAIITVWVTERGAFRLIKAEFLVLFRPRYNPNGVPDVDYFTLTVTPEGSSENKAKDDEWETVPRMLNIKNVCERQLRAWKNMKSNMKQASIDRQMNSMFSSMMRSAVVQNARDARMMENLRNGR